MVGCDRLTATFAVGLLLCAPIAQAMPAGAEKDPSKPPDKHMTLTGPINARFVAAIAEVSSKYPTIRLLVIDSEGGEIEAAMRLGKIVRDHGWDVAVKNKCLSACANYVFPSGKRKFVLPNSWVGIHEKTRRFVGGDGSVHYVSGNEIAGAMSLGVDPVSAAVARKWDDDESDFYWSLGLSTSFVQNFMNYVSARKRILGVEDINEFPDVPGCPRYRFWALNKKQLERMGVTGIDNFWFPANKADVGTLYRDKILPAGSIYIGGAEGLGALCKGRALNWFQRLLLKRDPQP